MSHSDISGPVEPAEEPNLGVNDPTWAALKEVYEEAFSPEERQLLAGHPTHRTYLVREFAVLCDRTVKGLPQKGNGK